jgi:hypothetical protein
MAVKNIYNIGPRAPGNKVTMETIGGFLTIFNDF